MSSVSKQINELPVTLAGRLIYRLIPYRKKVIKSNIDLVYQDRLTQGEKKHLIKAYYSHLMTSIKELFLMRFMSEQKIRDKVIVRGHEYMLSVIAHNQGVLVLTGHFGNWEMAPLGGVMNFDQFKGQFHFIRRNLQFKALERMVFKRYYQAGLNVIPKKNSLNQVVDALEQNHAVIFVLDQHAQLENKDGIAVEFFGKKAGTYRSLASLSRHTNVPVVPAASYRLPSGKHVLEFFAPLKWQEYDSTQESLYRNTLSYNQALEQMVLAHPEQWSWMHKRWKLKD